MKTIKHLKPVAVLKQRWGFPTPGEKKALNELVVKDYSDQVDIINQHLKDAYEDLNMVYDSILYTFVYPSEEDAPHINASMAKIKLVKMWVDFYQFGRRD